MKMRGLPGAREYLDVNLMSMTFRLRTKRNRWSIPSSC
jgi:hypothetical protein